MKNFTPELITKAKAAKSAEELQEIAKASGVALSAMEAKSYYAQLNTTGAVDDDDLEVVAGGGFFCGSDDEAKSNSLLGKKVRMLDGSICPKCRGNIGTVVHKLTASGSSNSNGMHIICDKCGMVLSHGVNPEAIEVL